MPSEKDYLKRLISRLSFSAVKGAPEVYSKIYRSNYKISVDFHNEKIDYPLPLKVTDQSTCNFDSLENFVVLECINRLLEKGYEPQHLELERKWTLGRTTKGGKADITIYDRSGNSLIIIECKTSGFEYEKEKRRLYENGGQLFSYRQQDNSTRFLCLYASHVHDNKIVYDNLVIQIEDRPEVLNLLKTNPDELAYLTANDANKLHEVWKEQYNSFATPNGIFDDDVVAYKPRKVPIKRKDLTAFAEEEGRKFFNEFAEILRHNNISDQSNAFNRILSLVLCKIVDEQKKPNQITDFQIQDIKESAEAIQDRLQKLYALGMEKFLEEKIVYISEKEIQEVVKSFPAQEAQDRIRNLFRQQKFYSNNEFAFKEVHNEKLFYENARVLNEILQLLQYKQFRYSRKDSAEHKKQKRYLGEFFELLLDAGYKQTAGQFFTPLPITKFIVSSIPIREIIKEKIEQKQSDFLPYLIDYACGSGHFLVEAIDEIQEYIDDLKPEYDDEINAKIKQWQATDWTKAFLHGVEKDYRLARTAKLACFMNGDGETNIVFGDGLEDYRHTEKNFPESFDILVANPPYSIHGFKPHTKQSLKRNSFELMESLTDDASQIEVLFVERIKQLLHPNAMAGVILPNSILANAGIYTRAREILLRHFEIRAIVELGSNTFMATGTSTVVLFLKKREEKCFVNANYVATDYIIYNKKREKDFADTQGILMDYAATLGFTLEDYQTFLSRFPNDAVTHSEWYQDYLRWFNNLNTTKKLRQDRKFANKIVGEQILELKERFYGEVLQREKEKFEFFFLVSGQRTLIVRTPSDSKDEKKFLGYEFSKARGKEGMKLYKLDNKHQTSLYDEESLDNPEKLNFIIRQMMLHPLYDYSERNVMTAAAVPVSLSEQVRIADLQDCFDFSRIEFEKQINLLEKQKIDYTDIWKTTFELKKLEEVAALAKGTSITENQVSKGNIPVIAGGQQPAYYHNQSNFDGNTITVSASGAYAGFLSYHSEPIFASDCSVIQSQDENAISTKLIFFFLKKIQDLIYEYFQRGQAQPHVYISDLQNLKIPYPPRKIQEKILKEIEALDVAEQTDRRIINELKKAIKTKLDSSFNSAPKKRLFEVANLERGRFNHRPRNAPHLYLNGTYPFIQTGDVARALGKEVQHTQFLNNEGAKISKLFHSNTILMTIAANIGNTTILTYEAYAPDSIVGITPKDSQFNTKYLEYFLRTKKLYLEEIASQNAQKNINLQTLEPLLIATPERPEQDRFIKEEISPLEAKIAAAQTRLEGVEVKKAQVLQKYL